MSLDLNSIKFDVNPTKNKKAVALGVFKTNDGKIPRSPEEIL